MSLGGEEIMNQEAPVLSVVVLVAGARERVDLLVQALARQSIAENLEVVFVDISETGTSAPPAVPGVSTKIINQNGSCDLGRARAEALRQARAPIVAYLEDHTVPAPGWAAAVRDAFRDPGVIAAAYAFTNGSPDTWWYRSVFMVEYGTMAHPLPAKPANLVPANNVAYRRDPLLALEGRLDTLLEQDVFLQKALGAGYRVALAREALVAHQTNTSTWDLLRGHYEFGRIFAARRVQLEGWSLTKRLCAAPLTPWLVPLLRLKRVATGLPGRALWRDFVAALPAFTLIFTTDAIGEAHGYLDGEARPRSLIWLELQAERARRS
jgi:cellulose synthase/poly-beta-1,6-N-acetylglucosamine synthase-like glycosyltransferase